jgi:hypothetical protein
MIKFIKFWYFKTFFLQVNFDDNYGDVCEKFVKTW